MMPDIGEARPYGHVFAKVRAFLQHRQCGCKGDPVSRGRCPQADLSWTAERSKSTNALLAMKGAQVKVELDIGPCEPVIITSCKARRQ